MQQISGFSKCVYVRMMEHVRLTQQEQARLQVLNNLLAGYMTTEQAAQGTPLAHRRGETTGVCFCRTEQNETNEADLRDITL